MVKIGKNSAWYRPYQYGKYTIQDIRFYDENGVIINTNSGWLENGWLETGSRVDLQSIELDVDDIPLKRKENLNIKGAFIVSDGRDYVGTLKATLYIHKDIVHLESVGYRKVYDSIREFFKGVTSDNQEFEISTLMKYLKDDYYKCKDELKEVLKKFDSDIENFNFSGNHKEFIEQMTSCIENIEKCSKRLLEEQKKLVDYDVEDYLEEMNSND